MKIEIKRNQDTKLSEKEKLTKKDQERLQKIIPLEKKKSFLTGRLLLNEFLTQNKIPNSQIIKNKNGKPLLLSKQIFFNLSHSYQYTVFASDINPIGIDIEKIRKANISTISIFCTPKEQTFILKNKKEQTKRFWQIFCLKEAYIKMQGTNFSEAKDIEFQKKNGKFISNKPELEFQILPLKMGYIIASCIKKY